MTNETKLINKVKKLLAMAQDKSSLEEACTAARMARSLIDKYQISEDKLVDEDTTFGESVSCHKGKVFPVPFNVMSVTVGKLNDCLVRGERFDAEFYVSFSGMSADVLCAKLLYEYLIETCKLGEKEHTGRRNKNAYRIGFCSAIQKRVTEIIASRETLKTASGTSLVVCKNKLVESHFGVVSYSRANISTNQHSSSFKSGYSAGNRANINRVVSGSNQKALH